MFAGQKFAKKRFAEQTSAGQMYAERMSAEPTRVARNRRLSLGRMQIRGPALEQIL